MFYITRDAKLPFLFNLFFYFFWFSLLFYPKSLQSFEILKRREFILFFRSRFFSYFLIVADFLIILRSTLQISIVYLLFELSLFIHSFNTNIRFPKQADFAWYGFLNKRDRFNYNFINRVELF